MPFGQLVIGPPGSGKTTYCHGMLQFFGAAGRKVAIINLDPANDVLPYECAVDVRHLVDLSDVMDKLELGPNGGLLYCMEYLEKNIDWLKEKLDLMPDTYFLFDCPGQSELYIHHGSMPNIVQKLQKWGFMVTAVHLVDSYYCSVASTYISAVLLSLSTMLHLELPHINVLSKVDLIEKYGRLSFDLEFFTDVQDLAYLNDRLDEEPFGQKYSKLSRVLCELIEDFSLVSFTTLNIQDKESVLNLVKMIDKSNGYVFGGLTMGNDAIMSLAAGEISWNYDRVAAVQEKYMADEWDDEEEGEAEEDGAAGQGEKEVAMADGGGDALAGTDGVTPKQT